MKFIFLVFFLLASSSITKKLRDSRTLLFGPVLSSAVLQDFVKDPQNMKAFADATHHSVHQATEIVRDVVKLASDLQGDKTLVFNMTNEDIIWNTYPNDWTWVKWKKQFSTRIRPHGYGE